MAKQTKLKEEQESTSSNLLNSLLKGYSDTHFNFIDTKPVRISSGSLLLDSQVAVKTGTIVRLGGSAEVGKTSQALLFAQNYMDTMPKSKTVYVNAESKFSEEMKIRSGMKFTEDPNTWDFGSVFVLKSNVFDTICDTLYGLYKNMYEAGEHLCFVLDSVDMLVLKSSLDKGMTEGKKPAGINYLTKELFRRICPLIENYQGLGLIITQYSATFQLDPYSKTPPQMMEGNQTNALNHQASYAFYYRQRFAGDYILEKEKEKPDPEKNKILGVYAKVDIRKSATDNTGFTIAVPIKKGKVGNCVWREKECVDLMLTFGLVEKSGAWLSFHQSIIEEAQKQGVELKEKIQGLDNLYDYLEINKPIFEFFFNKVKQAIT